MASQISKNYSILILSCDKYADLWKPFFLQFHTYWPQCPFPLYLGSNTKKYSDRKVTTILSGEILDWSSDLLSLLDKIKEEYVFIWLEDLFPIHAVDTEFFSHCFTFMKEQKANHIHIAPGVRPDGMSSDPLFGFYERGSPYRVTVPGFWNKKHLQKMLIPGENPWKFEIMGSYRSSYSDGYYTVMKSIFEFIRVVDKGKIRHDAFEYCQKNNIPLDLQKRQVFSGSEKIESIIKGFIFNVILSIPWKKRLRFMDMMRHLAVSY